MNRRNFLRSLGSALAVAIVPFGVKAATRKPEKYSVIFKSNGQLGSQECREEAMACARIFARRKGLTQPTAIFGESMLWQPDDDGKYDYLHRFRFVGCRI